MKWATTTASGKVTRAEIEQQRVRDVLNKRDLDWYYLYVWEDNSNFPKWDYQRETLDQAKSCALDNFNIPIDSWHQV